jgi:hypothetical protein
LAIVTAREAGESKTLTGLGQKEDEMDPIMFHGTEWIQRIPESDVES